MSIGSFGRSVADMFVHILICCHPADRLEYASKTILALDGRNDRMAIQTRALKEQKSEKAIEKESLKRK